MKISNGLLEATFKTKGAELVSLKKLDADREYIWCGHPDHWGRHAPVLFPFVGKLKGDAYLHEGKTYVMGQHGFARDSPFSIIYQHEDAIRFTLSTTSSSFKVYPFQFELLITYELDGTSLKTVYEVRNLGAHDLYFSIGGHPAFSCPMVKEEIRADYWLEFNEEEKAPTHLLNDEGLFSGETAAILDGKKLEISDALFDRDALVFKNLNSDRVSLVSPAQKWLTFHFQGFPYLGIWSKSSKSPFICIEPWHGRADDQSHDQDLAKKEGIRILKKAGMFTCSYQVDIH